MSSTRTFVRLVWMCCVLALTGYAVAAERAELALLTVAAGAIAAWMMRGGVPRSLPRLSINLLVVAATVNVLYRVMVRGVPTVEEMTDFLVYILLIKMFDRGRARDEAQLLGLSVFVVIGAVLTSNSFLLGLVMMVYSPLAIAAAMSYQVYAGVRGAAARRAEAASPHAPDRRRGAPPLPPMVMIEGRRARRDFRLTAVAAVVLCVLLSIVGFVIAPRTLTQQVLGSLGEVRAGVQTDFRDRIDLGRGGNIATSEEPVMDVALRDQHGTPITQTAEPLYLRGAVLDIYDAARGQWSSSAAGGQTADVLRGAGSRPVELGGVTPGPTRLVQRISIRNARKNSPLFAVWRPITLTVDDGKVHMQRSDMIPRHEDGGRITYTVESAPVYTDGPRADDLARIDIPPRVADLARQLAAQAGVPADPAQRDLAATRRLINTIVIHLRDQYAYDLDQTPAPEGEEPIEMFLFNTRKGHCEYFAAALTCMLRSVGVPARVVTGFAAGEYNALSGVYVVRKSDAHAWVEAKVRPDRWESFDATPPGSLGSQIRASRGILARLRQFYEALEFSWINNVVAFDTGRKIDLGQMLVDQKERMGWARRWLARLGDTLSGFFGVGRWPALVLAGLTALLVLVGVGIAVRRALLARGGSRLATLRRPPPVTHTARAYERMLRALDRAGLGKPAWRPPLRHAHLLTSSHPDPRVGALVGELASAYYADRFGAAAPPPGEPSALAAQLESVLSARARTPAGRAVVHAS